MTSQRQTKKEKRLELIREAKDLGLKSVTIDGVVYNFYEVEEKPKEITQEEAEAVYKPLSVFDDLSDDEIKYWATPYYDEIQAMKKLREEQLKDKNGED